MNDPLVSIIIPCYNAECYIREAIQSALDQKYATTEIVVIDDGSTDGSLDVIRSFGDHIRWETGPNRGGCAARNRGLALANGELIQFLDADDLLHTDKLEVQVAELLRSKADVVFCDGRALQGDRVIGTYRRTLEFGDDSVIFVLGGQLPTPAPIHFRANLQKVGGFREDLPCSQERDLHLRLACAGLRFHHLPKMLLTVRKLEGSVSSDLIKVLDQHRRIAVHAYQSLKQNDQLNDERSRALAGMLATDARAYLRHGLGKQAEEYFTLARSMHPEGGLTSAYRHSARIMRRFLGPERTERLVGFKRWFGMDRRA